MPIFDFRLPPSDLTTKQARMVHAYDDVNLQLLVLGCEYWRYSKSREQELKAQIHVYKYERTLFRYCSLLKGLPHGQTILSECFSVSVYFLMMNIK